jgi:hypothetical protein
VVLLTTVISLVGLVGLVGFVAACGSDDDDALADGPEDATATTTSTTLGASTTTVPGAPDDGTLVELSTSGGLDGRGLGNLVVSSAGEVSQTGRTGPDEPVQQATLPPDELDSLAALLERTDFAEVPAEPEGGMVCADGYVYIVHYGRWTVTADDCTVPDELAPLLDRLQDLLARFD